jgi:hypothetical protein
MVVTCTMEGLHWVTMHTTWMKVACFLVKSSSDTGRVITKLTPRAVAGLAMLAFPPAASEKEDWLLLEFWDVGLGDVLDLLRWPETAIGFDEVKLGDAIVGLCVKLRRISVWLVSLVSESCKVSLLISVAVAACCIDVVLPPSSSRTVGEL